MSESEYPFFDKIALGKKIKSHRIAAGLTQSQLANIINISSGFLSDIETGKGSSISLKNLGKIASALNITIDDLLCDSLSFYNNSLKSDNKLINEILEEISVFDEIKLQEFKKIIDAFKYINLKHKNSK